MTIIGMITIVGLVSGSMAIAKGHPVAGSSGLIGGVTPPAILIVGEQICRSGGEYCGWGILAALVSSAPFVAALLACSIVGASRRARKPPVRSLS